MRIAFRLFRPVKTALSWQGRFIKSEILQNIGFAGASDGSGSEKIMKLFAEKIK